MLLQDHSDTERREFISRVIDPGTMADVRRRRDEFAIRRRMLRGDFEADIAAFIRQNRFSSRGSEVAKFASNIHNPLRRLAKRVAVVYKKRAIRTLPDASEEQQRMFAAMNRHVRIDRRMKNLNREAWALNTVIVVPTPFERDGDQRIRLRFFSGDNAEVLQNADDVFGLPDVLGYRSGQDARTGRRRVTTVDAACWQTWDDTGRPVGDPIEHPLGRFPGSIVRMTDPPEDDGADYWDPDDGKGLRDCGLEVGYIAATMGWIRKAQNRLLMILMMEDESGGSEGQIHHPEAGMKILQSPDQVRIMIENFDQPITNFLAQIKANQDEVAEVHAGVPSTLADPEQRTAENISERIEEASALTEVREEQIEEFEALEQDLHPVLHAIGRWRGHTLAVDPAVLASGLQITFPPLQSADTRAERLAIAIQATEFGVADQVDYVMAEHAISTAGEAHDYVMERARRRAELDEFRASRNMPADPAQQSDTSQQPMEEDPAAPGEQLAAAQGRVGGRAGPPR